MSRPHAPLILASASPRRAQILEQADILPSAIIPAEIDETPIKAELPRDHALRLAREKAAHIAKGHPNSFILAADTVVACGRRILPKAETRADVESCLRLLSGRRHHVFGGICLITPDGKTITRVCDTAVKFKTLSKENITHYLDSGEGIGKAGGYAVQGLAGAYISFLQGSYSNVVGLSIYDIMQLLEGNGFFRSPASTTS